MARSMLSMMTTPTPTGSCSAPTPTSGPKVAPVRSSATSTVTETWYERWARPWEFQALIKARPVAGDAELGDAFIELDRALRLARRARSRSHPRGARHEGPRRRPSCSARASPTASSSAGRGGIRDVEFAVQLLQRVHGRHDPSIRSRTTLDALRAARRRRIRRDDATPAALAGAYAFLRTVEHRLQLWDEQQTHTLPSDRAGSDPTRPGPRLPRHARRDRGRSVRDRRNAVTRPPCARSTNGCSSRPSSRRSPARGALSPEAAEERLVAFGFHDAAHTRVRRSASSRKGLTRRSRLMQQLLPVILDWLSGTPDPDLGLLQLRKLAEGPTRARRVGATFGTKPSAAERACRVLGSSRLRRRRCSCASPRSSSCSATTTGSVDERDAATQLIGGRARDAALASGRRARARRDSDGSSGGELLRIASQAICSGSRRSRSTARELADLADACVEAALRSLEPDDALRGHRHRAASAAMSSRTRPTSTCCSSTTATAPATSPRPSRPRPRSSAEIGATTSEGQTFRIDANLRPEGKQGSLARSLDGYRQYYERWALTWEFQSLLRARAGRGRPRPRGRASLR